MKGKKIIILFVIILGIVLSFYYKLSVPIEIEVEKELSGILKHEDSIQYFNESQVKELRLFSDKMTVLGYSDIETSSFKHEDQIYVLIEGRSSLVKDEDIIAYITATLNEYNQISDLIISELIKIRPEKSNF